MNIRRTNRMQEICTLFVMVSLFLTIDAMEPESPRVKRDRVEEKDAHNSPLQSKKKITRTNKEARDRVIHNHSPIYLGNGIYAVNADPYIELQKPRLTCTYYGHLHCAREFYDEDVMLAHIAHVHGIIAGIFNNRCQLPMRYAVSAYNGGDDTDDYDDDDDDRK